MQMILWITNKERCYIVDVNELEKRAALDSLKGEGTYAQAVEVAEKDTTINSLNENITTLNGTVETLTNDVNNLTEQNSSIIARKLKSWNNSISTLTVERWSSI